MKKKRQQTRRLVIFIKILLIPVGCIFALTLGLYWYSEEIPHYVELDLELIGYPYNPDTAWFPITYSTWTFENSKKWIVRYEESCNESDCGTIQESLSNFDMQFEAMNWIIEDNGYSSWTSCEYMLPEFEFLDSVEYDYRVYIPAKQANYWEEITYACVVIYVDESDTYTSRYLQYIVMTVNPSPLTRFGSGL